MAKLSHSNRKAATDSAFKPVQSSWRSRPFAPQPKSVPDPSLPDLQPQRENRRTFGHHLENINLCPRQPTPPPIQPKLTLEQSQDVSTDASADLESHIHRAKGGGQPLEAGLQQSMGQAMRADFSRVRVHTDAQSDWLNRSIQAKAFATGQDVFFRRGAYQPRSQGGQELIAHELTHVMQQNRNTVQRETADNAESKQQGTEQPNDRRQDGLPRLLSDRVLPGKPLSLSQTAPNTIQRAKIYTGPPQKPIYDYNRHQKVTELQGVKPVSKELAQEVEAVILKPKAGGVPQVDPAGWYWLGEHIPKKIVSHTKTGKTSTLNRPGWVRFHILNNLLGGSGQEEANLVPARQSDNASSDWRNFESNAKAQTQFSPIHFYAEVTYHNALPPDPLNPGNIHLGFFPNRIYAEYSTWDGKQWNLQGQPVVLTPPPPGTTANLVQYALTTATQAELNSLGIDNWLSGWLVYLQQPISQKVNHQTTKQNLYDIMQDLIRNQSMNVHADLNKLSACWPDLENALDKIGGLELHIVPGNRGGTVKVTLGKSMIQLFKDASRKKTPNQRNQAIQIYCKNTLQSVCVDAIFSDNKLMGANFDKNISEWDLYKAVVLSTRTLYKDMPDVDKNWITHLFEPMNGNYIFPINRQSFPKITEQIEILKTELAEKLHETYSQDPFIKLNSKAQEVVETYRSEILTLDWKSHHYDPDKLEELVRKNESALNQEIGNIYRAEEAKKTQQNLSQQPQPQTFGGNLSSPHSGHPPSYSQPVPQFHSQSIGTQYPSSNYGGGMTSNFIPPPSPEQQLQKFLSQSSPEQLLQLLSQASQEQQQLIVSQLSEKQRLELALILSQQQLISQQQQGFSQNPTHSYSQPFTNTYSTQQPSLYPSQQYRQQSSSSFNTQIQNPPF